MKSLIAFIAGAALATGYFSIIINARYQRRPPTNWTGGGGYIYAHVPYPDCPADFKLVADMPERDEVDMLTITCSPR